MLAQLILNPLLVFVAVLLVVELRDHGKLYKSRQIFFNIFVLLLVVASTIDLPIDNVHHVKVLLLSFALLLTFADVFHLPKESRVINIGEIAILLGALGFEATILF